MSALVTSTLLAGCVIACADAHAMPSQAPVASITSERVVYGSGQPIDLTFSITVPATGSVLPDFQVVDESGTHVQLRDVNGPYFWEAPGKAIDGTMRPGPIPPGQTHTELVTDLRDWYELDEPGTYRVRFNGEWVPASEDVAAAESQPVTSNSLVIRITRPASEDEPMGEPIEGQVIPLEEIWALDMPGTKPMRTAVYGWEEMRDVAPEGTMVREILRAINSHDRQSAPSGFAVRGTGMSALREAHAVLVHGQPARTEFARGEQVSLVFCSRNYGRRIHLKRVEQHGSVIEVSYTTFITWPMAADVNSSHVALIPVTISRSGPIHVEMRPVIDWDSDSPPPPPLDELLPRVCRSFTFELR